MGWYYELLNAMEDPEAFCAATVRWVDAVLAGDCWSPRHREALRARWSEVRKAKESPPWEEWLSLPGLLLLGSSSAPMYLGSTEKRLWTRLSGRFVGGTKGQLPLAETLEEEHRTGGLPSLSPSDVGPLCQRFAVSEVRMKHALAFAQRGEANAWVSVLPCAPGAVRTIDPLKERLIAALNCGNRRRGHPLLLNERGL